MGEMFGVVGIGIGMGLVGRFVMPGRHGLIKVVARDLKLLPRLATGTVPGRVGVLKVIARDVPLRWSIAFSVIGSVLGYVGSEAYFGEETRAAWPSTILGGVILLVLLMLGSSLVKTSRTRRLGIHRSRLA